jgi:retron-type reverse transcriptase
MKLSKVVPRYKGGSRLDINNYSPISLLPSISKVLEKVVYKRLYNFLINHDILYSSQYGFRAGYYTTDAISELVGKIVNQIDEGKFTLSVFLDLSKAFDSISHSNLLMKLDHYGVRGISLKWVKSYLSNRKQYTEVNKGKSTTLSVEYGVPQGSVLGPLLFLVIINDLNKCLLNTNCIMYADETTVYNSGANLDNIFQKMNNDLEILEQWFISNKLSLNINKTFLYCIQT